MKWFTFLNRNTSCVKSDDKMKRIFNTKINKFYRFFDCTSNKIIWCEDEFNSHVFRNTDSAEFVIKSFKLTDVELKDAH